MKFLSENRQNRCDIFGWFGFLKTKSEPNFGFPHIPTPEKLSIIFTTFRTLRGGAYTMAWNDFNLVS